MLSRDIIINTNGCRCLSYTPLKLNHDNPLVGIWSNTEKLTNDEGELSICTDIYTFYRNGSLKWKETIDGATIFIERGNYTISGNRLLTHYSKNGISEEAFFCRIDNKISLQFDFWESPVILTKNELANKLK